MDQCAPSVTRFITVLNWRQQSVWVIESLSSNRKSEISCFTLWFSLVTVIMSSVGSGRCSSKPDVLWPIVALSVCQASDLLSNQSMMLMNMHWNYDIYQGYKVDAVSLVVWQRILLYLFSDGSRMIWPLSVSVLLLCQQHSFTFTLGQFSSSLRLSWSYWDIQDNRVNCQENMYKLEKGGTLSPSFGQLSLFLFTSSTVSRNPQRILEAWPSLQSFQISWWCMSAAGSTQFVTRQMSSTSTLKLYVTSIYLSCMLLT